MNKIYVAIFSQKDEMKRIAMVQIVNCKFQNCSVQELADVFSFLVLQIANPCNRTDLFLHCGTLKIVTNIFLKKDFSAFLERCVVLFGDDGDVPTRLWALEKVLDAMGETERDGVVSELRKKSRFSSYSLSGGIHFPAYLCTARFFCNAIPSMTTVLNWLALDHSKTSIVCFERSFVQLRSTTHRMWEFEPDMVMESLKSIFEIVIKARNPSQASPLSMVLMSEKTLDLAELASQHVVTNFSETVVADIMGKLSFWPMKHGMEVWFKQLFTALKEENKREGLYRLTFGGALENLVLQMFVPSTRLGAFESLQLLLLGYLTEPSAFHSVLPALKHLLEYMTAEKKFVENNPKVSFFAKPDSDVTSLSCVDFILNQLEGSPEFNVGSKFNDLDLARADKVDFDIVEHLSRFVFDMMSFFTGFKEWYMPGKL